MKLIKYFWALSLLAFLGLNLLMYIYFPDQVTVVYDNEGNGAVLMNKGDFFYSAMGILLLINIALAIFGNGVLHLPKELLFLPKKSEWLKNKETQQALLFRAKAWTRGLAAIINLFLLTFVGILFSYHYKGAPDVNYMLYIIPVLFVAWLIYFFVLFSNTKVLEEED